MEGALETAFQITSVYTVCVCVWTCNYILRELYYKYTCTHVKLCRYNLYAHVNTHTSQNIPHRIFKITKYWNQSKCPSIGDLLNKLLYMHTVVLLFNIAIKKEERRERQKNSVLIQKIIIISYISKSLKVIIINQNSKVVCYYL